MGLASGMTHPTPSGGQPEPKTWECLLVHIEMGGRSQWDAHCRRNCHHTDMRATRDEAIRAHLEHVEKEHTHDR